jgi:antibiotic biosynthesis monooxygenase (ABM) superfamily enzyme
MWIRSAFWSGAPKPGMDADFRSAINAEIVPGLAALPGVQDVKALWPQRLEDNPPAIHCQIIVQFGDEAAVDAMLASPERAAMRARVREIAGMFDGAISHIDYAVGA